MPAPEFIEDLLYRRSDLGTFVHHFTKGTAVQCEAALLDILGGLCLKASKPWGIARDFDGSTLGTPVTQRTVCFTDTPIEHSWMMLRNIVGRSWDLQPYGVVFSKEYARTRGCHRLWYLDTSGPDPMAQAVHRVVNSFRAVIASNPAMYPLEAQDLLRMTPLMEWQQPGQDFVWEREWRHRGDFNFESPTNVVAVFAPESAQFRLRVQIDGLSPEWSARKVPLIDPNWGVEKIIHSLSTGA